MTVERCSSLLCISGVLLFLLLVPSHCLQIQLETSPVDQGSKGEVQASVEKILPRKLRVRTEKVLVTVQKKTETERETAYNQKNTLSEQKKASAAAARPRPGHAETWQQWAEDGGDSSEFFTMDYHRVRGRRHIHNKGLPVGP